MALVKRLLLLELLLGWLLLLLLERIEILSSKLLLELGLLLVGAASERAAAVAAQVELRIDVTN